MQTTMKLLKLAAVVGLALGHSSNDINLEDTDLSLPDLATLDGLNPPKWGITGAAEFNEGRIIMTPKAGDIGSLKNDIPVAYDSWTLEAIFRASGAQGKTGGAFSMRYASELSDKVYDSFDGLEIVVDSEGSLGSSLHAYINDGSYDLSTLTGDDLYKKSFGSCLVNYQDSSVPNTVRIAYYAGNLVIQVNNRVCIKTQKVKLPTDYKLSVAASSGSKHERFELLKLKTYGGVISEILENDGFPAPQPKVVTEYVKMDTEGQVVAKDQVEKSTPPQGEETKHENIKFDSDILAIMETLHKSNKDILENFSSMESKIMALSDSSGGSNADFSYLEEQNKKLKQLSSEISQASSEIAALKSQLSTVQQNVQKEVEKVVASVNRLNADNINHLRDNEHSIEQLNKEIQYLVMSEKEREQNPINDLVNGLKYLIIPILMASVGLCFFAYRLRHDIKTKLL